MKSVVYVLWFIALCSCESKKVNTINKKVLSDSIGVVSLSMDGKIEQWKADSTMLSNRLKNQQRKLRAEQSGTDKTLMHNEILSEALKIATRNIHKETFVKKYEVIYDDFSTSVEIDLGYHFTAEYPHLIIKRTDFDIVCVEIYSVNNSQFKQEVFYEQSKLSPLEDTIQDINGDGFNDFVVNGYGTNGCCLKAFSVVYILKSNKKSFLEEVEFINPTFSPKEKMIRGVCYGHPGQTEMYKYRWKGESIDTVEYVSFHMTEETLPVKTGKIEITKWANKRTIILDDIPKEYLMINGINWFKGIFDN